MSHLEDLLVVQGHDTVLDQLRHRRTALPARATLRDVESQRQALVAQHAAAVAARNEVAARQANLEKDIAASEARIAEIDRRMYSGEISAARDLQAMGGEIASIKSRVSTLEDRALETMEEREPLDAAVTAIETTDLSLLHQAAQLRQDIAAAEVEIDNELLQEESARSAAAAGVPDDLLVAYETLRVRLGGIGAARLEHATCMGCNMKLPATELDRIRHQPPDAVVHCDQCGRILVRQT